MEELSKGQLAPRKSSFQYIAPTEEQKVLMQEYRDKFEALYNEVAKLPYSRGTSLAKTKIEEAAMWVNKAITNND